MTILRLLTTLIRCWILGHQWRHVEYNYGNGQICRRCGDIGVPGH